MGERANEMQNYNNPDGMSKFRKGDRVRIMQRDTIYEVIEVIEDYGGRYRLSDCGGTWGGQYLTLVEPYNPSESDLTISLAKLREVLEGMADCDGFVVETPDTIINRIKQELK